MAKAHINSHKNHFFLDFINALPDRSPLFTPILKILIGFFNNLAGNFVL